MKSVTKQRLDLLLVQRGLAESREKAQALILAGAVLLDGRPAQKPGHSVTADAPIELRARLPYASRGGFKLAAALDHFEIRVAKRVCLDIGASTGGFTDCLLQRDAARVHAVDVGAGQLDWKLRQDPRVVIHDKLNARYLQPSDIGETVDLAVCDVSFISATLILPTLPALLREPAEVVILVKPQFEVGRRQVGKGGIVRDPDLHQRACGRVTEEAVRLGWRVDIIESPILGAEGNKEFLLYGRH